MGDRVPEATLPNNFADGQVLYGADVNKIILLLRTAVNYNKDDLDKLIFGSDTELVFHDTDDMEDYLLTTTPDDGDFCVVMNAGSGADTIYVYQYSASSAAWVVYSTFSLLSLFYQNRGWFTGTAITTTGSNIEIVSSTVGSNVSLNSLYLNTDTSYVYRCVSISGDNSYWDFELGLSGEMVVYEDETTTSVNYTLVDNEDKTFSDDAITDVTIIIPDTVAHGFYGGVNIAVPAGGVGAITFTNNSSFTLKLVKYGVVISNYTPTVSKTVGLAFYCDGININCYITEV